ncbi:hypothetical protein [Chitinimonas sp. BJB300]|uniref:hypothetical protein n=1 Tax=Chitinimonas sp. BJB300 TaxID=1559339 RepID=UPI000C10F77D|nr:hypothetical protein [Chitinimonas sp. BJB300]PHV10491.1 hypothetical protein CSQ89_15895 [Chitinimonas sp. BJB300]TSJ89872.1 hypothetical protein FG002_006590 [Chitinimonas sp. BJB300]
MKIDQTAYQSLAITLKCLAPAHAERWLYLLAHDAKRWQKISPFDAWPNTGVTQQWPATGLAVLIQRLLASSLARQEVAVLDTYYGQCYRAQLNEMLSVCPLPNRPGAYRVEAALLEGFISIIPGHLAFLCNHEEGQALWGWEQLEQHCALQDVKRTLR